MNWIELAIDTVPQGIEPLADALKAQGIRGLVIEDSADFESFLAENTPRWDYVDEQLAEHMRQISRIKLYLPEDEQGREQLESIGRMIERLRADSERFGSLELTLSGLQESDWENNWKQYFKPFRVGERFFINPSWETLPDSEGRIVLEIDPASSFGTGTHETTQLCIEQLERTTVPGCKVLDLGCGSGILSIAALLSGASCAVGVDVELNAVHTSIENAQKNHLGPDRFTALCGDLISEPELCRRLVSMGPFEVICANIVADVLIGMSSRFGGLLAPQGKLILSGIISSRSDEVIDAVERNGFRIEAVSERKDWVALLARRAD